VPRGIAWPTADHSSIVPAASSVAEIDGLSSRTIASSSCGVAAASRTAPPARKPARVDRWSRLAPAGASTSTPARARASVAAAAASPPPPLVWAAGGDAGASRRRRAAAGCDGPHESLPVALATADGGVAAHSGRGQPPRHGAPALPSWHDDVSVHHPQPAVARHVSRDVSGAHGDGGSSGADRR